MSSEPLVFDPVEITGATSGTGQILRSVNCTDCRFGRIKPTRDNNAPGCYQTSRRVSKPVPAAMSRAVQVFVVGLYC